MRALVLAALLATTAPVNADIFFTSLDAYWVYPNTNPAVVEYIMCLEKNFRHETDYVEAQTKAQKDCAALEQKVSIEDREAITTSTFDCGFLPGEYCVFSYAARMADDQAEAKYAADHPEEYE